MESVDVEELFKGIVLGFFNRSCQCLFIHDATTALLHCEAGSLELDGTCQLVNNASFQKSWIICSSPYDHAEDAEANWLASFSSVDAGLTCMVLKEIYDLWIILNNVVIIPENIFRFTTNYVSSRNIVYMMLQCLVLDDLWSLPKLLDSSMN